MLLGQRAFYFVRCYLQIVVIFGRIDVLQEVVDFGSVLLGEAVDLRWHFGLKRIDEPGAVAFDGGAAFWRFQEFAEVDLLLWREL